MENLSFFDEQQTMENLNGVKDSKHLDVVKLNYESCESLTWQELFFGYDNLCAITYSSGIGFVCELLDRFEQAEIIFGCEDVMDYSMQSVMAYQCKLIERMRNKAYKKLAERVENGTLHLFVARDILSHEKIYLLSAKDGRKRVIWVRQICQQPHLKEGSERISAIWMEMKHLTGIWSVTRR